MLLFCNSKENSVHNSIILNILLFLIVEKIFMSNNQSVPIYVYVEYMHKYKIFRCPVLS